MTVRSRTTDLDMMCRSMRFFRVVVVAALTMASCVPLRDAGVESPDIESDLSAIASTQTAEVFEGTTLTLEAVASGGTPPYLFRWDQNGGPAELALAEVTHSTLSTGTLSVTGLYTFRVVASDSEGAHTTDFVSVEVLPIVTIAVPKFAVVGEPVVLSATLAAQSDDSTLQWEVTFGEASLSDSASANPTLTTAAAGTVRVRLTTTIALSGGAPTASERDFEIASVVDLTPQVLIETNFGDFIVALDGEAAPLHMANFLLYVDEGFYAGVHFHRNACSLDAESGECEPFVLQGGGYERVNGELEAVAVTRDPVPSEADNGLSNGVVYSVGLALSSGDRDSGTTQFFVNLSENNSFLDDQGFTVFGQVVDGTGVVDAIAGMETVASPIIPGEVSLPAEDVIMEQVARVPKDE